MSWIWIQETTKISDRWFLFGECYEYTDTSDRLVDCFTRCVKGKITQSIKQTIRKHYHVEVEGIVYYIPKDIAVDVPEPLEGHDVPRQELYARLYTDDTTDMIAEWRKATGIDISAKKREDKADYADEIKNARIIKEVYES